MKIYTRTGDDGSTNLLGPGRVVKSVPRVEAYGSVDELNAALGVARALDSQAWLTTELAAIQAQLFQVGAELATPGGSPSKVLERLADSDVARIEDWIDRLDADLERLENFLLPGGTPLAAQLHLARTVCRRTERRVVALRQQEPVEPRLIRYLNRLSDLLFVMARWCNAKAGVEETKWGGGRTGRT